MSGNETSIIGNIVDDVELRPTLSGIPRVQFRVVHTTRRKDQETGQWMDGRKLFLSVTFWRDFAENVAASMKKGDPIIVSGRLYSRQYVQNESNRISYELDPESIGHDLARGTATFTRRRRNTGGSVEVDAAGLPVVYDTDYRLDPDDDLVFGAAPEEPAVERELVPAG